MTSPSQISLTGASGFLGWHVRVRAHALSLPDAAPIRIPTSPTTGPTPTLDLRGRLIHVAGVNRGTPDEVNQGNVALAEGLAQLLRAATQLPEVLIYANSIQAGNGTDYGTGKAQAGQVLESVCSELGVKFVDVSLPNLFGEHGVANYNSVVATFCHRLVNDEALEVLADKELNMLHVQDAAHFLLTAQPGDSISEPLVTPVSVLQLKQKLEEFHRVYATGDVPVLASKFDVDLFNTYRSYLPVERWPIPLTLRTDPRGSLAETVRAHGGQSHTFFSTTVPGVTRGQHYHLRKIERFIVLAGSARISLRRMFTDEVVDFNVNGSEPVAIDMPTLWSHSITNTGSDTLFTQFWTNEIFDPQDPDTYPEEV